MPEGSDPLAAAIWIRGAATQDEGISFEGVCRCSTLNLVPPPGLEPGRSKSERF